MKRTFSGFVGHEQSLTNTDRNEHAPDSKAILYSKLIKDYPHIVLSQGEEKKLNGFK